MLLASAGVAVADKRMDEIAAGYEKEAVACRKSESGVAKVLEGARTLPDEAADTDKLDKGHAVVAGYCAELDAALELIKGATGYKAIERKLDEADNRIRRTRAASKKTIAELEPVMHRLIPKINFARSGPQQVTDRRTQAKFPSGRPVELPPLPGKWTLNGTPATDVAEYTDKSQTATVTAQPFKDGGCDAERRRIAGIDHVVELDAKAANVTWIASYAKHELACVQGPAGGVMGLVELSSDDAKLLDELGKLALRMMQTQLAPR